MVPITGQRCPVAGKVTVGLASHWSWVIDSIGHLYLYGLSHSLSKGEDHLAYTLLMG